MENIVWLENLRRGDIDVAGGKGANLGELVSAGFAVPIGFVVTAGAYLDSMEHAAVRAELAELATTPDVDPAHGSTRAEEMQTLVRKAGLSDQVRQDVVDAYEELSRHLGGCISGVAVRSSATAEDAADTSFAGMNKTFTNVRGLEQLLEAIVEAWASLFGERVLAYRAAHHLEGEPAIAVVVQAMVAAVSSGVAFTANPVTGDRSRVMIEAAFGQGEVVVGGRVEPDTYTVQKAPLRLLEEHIGVKSHKIVAGSEGDVTVELDPQQAAERVLLPAAVLEIARAAIAVEDHYGVPMDIEWCVDDRCAAARPGPSGDGAPPPTPESAAVGTVLVRGLGASPGVTGGPVRVLSNPSEGASLLDGEVLVAPMTNPDWLPDAPPGEW